MEEEGEEEEDTSGIVLRETCDFGIFVSFFFVCVTAEHKARDIASQPHTGEVTISSTKYKILMNIFKRNATPDQWEAYSSDTFDEAIFPPLTKTYGPKHGVGGVRGNRGGSVFAPRPHEGNRGGYGSGRGGPWRGRGRGNGHY